MEPVIRVEDLVKRHAGRGLGRRAPGFTAVDSASFSIFPGGTLALVGESGSGKSSLALCLGCLEPVTAGGILVERGGTGTLEEEKLEAGGPRLQIVVAGPVNFLNARW